MLTFRRASWIKVILILFVEVIFALFLFNMYPLLSMLFLGEGGDSLLYSSGNSVAWLVLPVLLPSLINLINIYDGKKDKCLLKVKEFYTIEILLIALYVPFIILMYNLMHNGFRI